jgi:hypothetical protein
MDDILVTDIMKITWNLIPWDPGNLGSLNKCTRKTSIVILQREVWRHELLKGITDKLRGYQSYFY